MKIYMGLIDEGTPVWCPVEAVHVTGDVYQIVGVNEDPEDTRWAFSTGDKVRCKYQISGDGEMFLAAYEHAAS